MGKEGSQLGREVVPTALTPAWCSLTWRRGQADALHDEQEHVIAAEVREDPSGRTGGETEAPQPHCLPFFSFGGGREQTPHWPLGVSQLLGSSFKIRQTRVLCPVLPTTNFWVLSLVCTYLFSTNFAPASDLAAGGPSLY